MRRQRIRHVRGRVRAPFLNGKIERFFRTFKLWWRPVFAGGKVRKMQRRLDSFVNWHNMCRPHSKLGVLTPDEAWRGKTRPKPIPIRSRDGPNIRIETSTNKLLPRRAIADDRHPTSQRRVSQNRKVRPKMDCLRLLRGGCAHNGTFSWDAVIRRPKLFNISRFLYVIRPVISDRDINYDKY